MLLVVGGLVAATGLAELALPQIDRRLAGSPPSMRAALAHAERAVLGADVAPEWFGVSPAPMTPPDLPPDLAALMADLENSPLPDPATVAPQEAVVTRVPPSELFKAWNSRYMQESLCGGDAFFHRFPGAALAFDPPEPSSHPPYRYLPSIATPAGLVTNAFGWRGPDLQPGKPRDVVRIAFVGASTTVGSHRQPFSYPEFLAPWLNLWAERVAPGVRFEVINAGREGISSPDIAAIVRQELAAVEPDVIVYYEGANQFSFRELMVPAGAERAPPPAALTSPPGRASLSRIALARRAQVFWRRLRPGAGAEPEKPAHQLSWPAGVDEQAPDPDSPNLPLGLATIVRDLDDIRSTADRLGARLLVTSFIWMVEPGMRLDPVDQEHFVRSLNLGHWPATYGEIRRMADFQNRVLQAYARSRGLWYIDMAAAYPRDPRLFGDAVHRAPEGDRLHAWLLLQQLVPLLRQELSDGRLPAAGRASVVPAPLSPVRRVVPACAAYASLKPAGVVRPDEWRTSVPEAELSRSAVVTIVTPPLPTSYAAEVPIVGAGTGPAVIRVRLRVVSGTVGIGVLNRNRTSWLVSRLINLTPAPVDVFLPLENAADASVLLVANARTVSGERSRVEIESVQLLR